MNDYMLYPINSKTRRLMDLSGMWNFKVDYENEGREKGYYNGLKDTTTIPVPSSYNDLFTEAKIRDHFGDVWYETEIYLPKEWENMCVNIRFYAAAHSAAVYLNGKEIGSHTGGFIPFRVNINEAGIFGDKNKLIVAVNNELSNQSLPCGHSIVKPNGKKVNMPSFDFFNYAGLNRPVKLEAIPKEFVKDIDIITDIKDNNGIVNYEIETTGNNEVYVEIYDEEKNKVAEAQGKKGIITISNAKLWNPKAAYLYTFNVLIKENNKLIDEYFMEFGIRTVKVEGNKLLINGKPFYFTGFGKHEDSETAGRGYNPPVIKRDFELIKWIGANSFRTSHYPYSEEIMQMADKEGIVVIDEVAAVGMLDVNEDISRPDSEKKEFFAQEDVQKETKEIHKKAIAELIQRDKNHPCVVMWSLLNEPDDIKKEARPYFEDIFKYAREIDKQNLPKTYPAHMETTPDTLNCLDLCDIISFNRYYGWYVFGGFDIEDGKEKFIEEMNAFAKLNKPILFTEFGADTMAGIHKLPSVMWSEEYQIEYMQMQFEVFDAYDSIIGEQLWNFADFQTIESIKRADGNKKGIFTRARQPKMVAHYLKKRWDKLPLNYKN